MEMTLIRFIALSLITVTLSAAATLLLLGMRHLLSDKQLDKIICSGIAAITLCILALAPETAGLQNAVPVLAKTLDGIACSRAAIAVAAAEITMGCAAGWLIFTLIVTVRKKRRRPLSLNEEMIPHKEK